MGKRVLFQADLNQAVIDLEKKNVYGPELNDVAKVCVACLYLGANKRKVKRLANCKNFEEYWSNLEKNHYFNEDQTINLEDLDTDIPFVMMINCAKGFVEREVEA